MNMSSHSPRGGNRVPRLGVPGAAAVAALATAAVALVVASVVLDQQEEQAAERLNDACQDNQGRAYEAALRVRDTTVSDAAATEAAREYVKEVRQAPVCFAENVRDDAEAVELVLKAGERPQPEYPKFTD